MYKKIIFFIQFEVSLLASMMLICILVTLMVFSINARNYQRIDDMLLDEYQFSQFSSLGQSSSDNGNIGQLSSGRSNEQYRWPNGELPYTFSDDFSYLPYTKKEIESVIAQFNAKFHGCIKIRPKTDEDWNYVEVIDR